MLSYSDLPLIPTQVIGSHGVPGWMWVVRDAVAAGKMGPADIDEALKDGVNLAIQDMEEAGVDIISDGEMQRADFTWNFHGKVHGLEPQEAPRKLGYPGPDQLDAFRCVAPLTVPNGYGTVAEWKYARTRTQKPLISTMQSPVTQAFRIDPGQVYRTKGEVAWALVPYINRELKEVVAAGCRHVQFDEPAYWTLPGGYPEMIEVFNACVEGVEATIGFHLCFGNFRGRPATSHRSLAGFAPFFKDLHADVIHIEFANRMMAEVELWEQYGGDKILCAGVIDVKGRSLEPVEVVAERIRTALRYCAPEKLWVAPDCGFSQTVRWLAVEKLKVMVQAAKLVREELGRMRLAYSKAIGRTLRLDEPEILGISTQTLVEEALAAGAWDEAVAGVNYFYDEMRIMHGILTTWLKDILRYITEHAGAQDAAARHASAGMVRMLEAYPIGEAGRDRCLEAIAAHDAGAAATWLDRMRLEFKNPHEILVAWVQDLLSYVAETWGEQAVLDSMLETHQSIWGERYAAWDEMTPLEKLALTVEGMRGGHFSGPGRRGDMVLVDEGDRYRMVMDPCGSGGVLRRGDPETGRGPYPVTAHGTNREPHEWTWQKSGVHWYCTHCCMSMEWLPGRRRGRPLRPLDHVLDAGAPCTWYIYKDEAKTRAYHYPRSGLQTPPDAPDYGEDWRKEYPGGE